MLSTSFSANALWTVIHLGGGQIALQSAAISPRYLSRCTNCYIANPANTDPQNPLNQAASHLDSITLESTWGVEQ